MVNCSFCDQEVNRWDTKTWHRMAVWVGGPKKHGSRLQESMGEYAHEECIQKALAGISPDMTPMV